MNLDLKYNLLHNLSNSLKSTLHLTTVKKQSL